MRYCIPRSFAALTAVSIIIAAPFAHAATFTSDAASPDWDNPTAWDVGVSFPQAGDSVVIQGARTIDSIQEFGDSGVDSVWSAGNFDADADTLTHSGNSTLHLTGSGLQYGPLSNPKGWAFSNKVGSVFSHETSGDFRITCGLYNSDQGGFVNEGTFQFTTGGGKLRLGRSANFKNLGTLVNHSGATVTINNSAAESATFSNGPSAIFSSIGDGSVIHYIAQRLALNGTFRALTNASIILDPTTAAGAVLACDPNTVFHGDAASTGVVHISGDWGIDLVGVASGNVVIAQMALFTLPASVPNITINMDASGASGGTGANPTPGTIVLRGTIGVGTNTITLNTPASMGDATLDINAASAKNGTFINAAGNTFTHSSASTFNIKCVSGGDGVKFRNDGTYIFNVDEGDLDISTAPGNQFINTTGGVVRCIVGAGDTARITGGAGAPFDNQGTVEALSGEMDLQAAISIVQLDGASLTGGTWDVTGELDMNPAATLGVLAIEGAGVVRLRTSGASFNELSGNLITNSGTFGIYSQQVYNVGSGDLVGNNGTFEFGLLTADTHAEAPKTGISNAANVFLTGATIDVVDLGDLSTATDGATWTVMVWTGTRTGTASLGNKPAGQDYTVVNNDKSVQLVFGSGPAHGSAVVIK